MLHLLKQNKSSIYNIFLYDCIRAIFFGIFSCACSLTMSKKIINIYTCMINYEKECVCVRTCWGRRKTCLFKWCWSCPPRDSFEAFFSFSASDILIKFSKYFPYSKTHISSQQTRTAFQYKIKCIIRYPGKKERKLKVGANIYTVVQYNWRLNTNTKVQVIIYIFLNGVTNLQLIKAKWNLKGIAINIAFYLVINY